MSARSTHVVERRDLVALHRRLQRADRVDLGHDDAAALAAQRLRAALAHLAEAADDGDLAAEHDVGRALEAVGQRVAAAVDVVELALGDRVVDVDRREQQRAGLLHLVEAMHAGRGLLGDAADARRDLRPAARPRLRVPGGGSEDDAPLLGVVRFVERGHLARLLELEALCTNSVASPPSSTISVGPLPSGHTSASFVHHQYSSSVSPFQANTGMPRGFAAVPPVSGRPTATAAAAWSCVEKMLHDTQRTSAPSSASVSISTAVWIVMCSEPMMRAPASGFVLP